MEKFKESGLPILPLGFCFLIVLILFSMLFIIKSYSHHFNIKGFGHPLEDIKITFETDKRYSQLTYLICYNDFCKSPQTNEFRTYYFSSLTSDEPEFFEKKVDKIYIAVDNSLKNSINEIKDISINIGNKDIYLSKDDISKLEKKEFSIKVKSEGGKEKAEKYTALILSDVSNYRGTLSHISNIILSLFYNWKFFIIPYFWLFVASIVFIFNREKLNFKFSLNKKIYYLIFGGIVALGTYLRLVDITYFPLWTDEVYTKQVALQNFLTCFKDAGNPPLFFLLEYLFTKIFSLSTLTLRFLPFVFGILFIIYTFLLSKETYKTEDNKLPLFALFVGFMAAINTVNIYHSQEARAYSLCMFLTVGAIYCLFGYLKSPNNKKLIILTVFNILLINTNYYLILFSIANYIWGVVDLAQNKNIQNLKEYFKFTIAYVVAVLTALPYFIISSENALSGGFNGWIPKLDHDVFLYTINEYFINKYVFLALCAVVLANLIIVYIPKKYLEKNNVKTNPNKENLFLYLIYTLALIIIMASLISIFVKPIFHKRVLLSIYSLLFLLEMVSIGSIVEFINENKIIKSIKFSYFAILTFAYFSITAPMPIRGMYNINSFMNFVKNDIKQYGSDYEIHVIVTDTKDYLKEYPEIYDNKKIKFHFLDTNSGKVLTSIKKDDYMPIDKKGVIYFNGIGVNVEDIKGFNPAIRIYGNNSAVSAKLVYN